MKTTTQHILELDDAEAFLWVKTQGRWGGSVFRATRVTYLVRPDGESNIHMSGPWVDVPAGATGERAERGWDILFSSQDYGHLRDLPEPILKALEAFGLDLEETQ